MTIKQIWKIIWLKTSRLADIREDTDAEATISSIRRGVEFKGTNVWLLFLAVVVASVGLNVNSTAVIIGAMLISPLMGPINGIGLAIGISDSDLLRNSLRNLLVMVLVSILAATIYFLLTPLSDAQSELLARTRPSIFDVLIAFFGGMAGILAVSRKSQAITIISGVSIATALMPPLCTVGFGLATLQWRYVGGALYLFFINSFFIALATFAMVRYLRFPAITHMGDGHRRIVKRTITIFSILVIVPSVLLAINMVREAAFHSAAIKYINSVRDNDLLTDVEIVNTSHEYARKGGEIRISFVGRELSDKQINYLHNQLAELGLQNTKLNIRQTNGGTFDLGEQATFVSSLLDKREAIIEQQDSTIVQLNKQLQKLHGEGAIYRQVAREIAVQYPQVASFSVNNSIYTDIETLQQDTIPVLFVNWKKGKHNANQTAELRRWLQVRLNLKRLEVYEN